jgi:hypothetical protein
MTVERLEVKNKGRLLSPRETLISFAREWITCTGITTAGLINVAAAITVSCIFGKRVDFFFQKKQKNISRSAAG